MEEKQENVTVSSPRERRCRVDSGENLLSVFSTLAAVATSENRLGRNIKKLNGSELVKVSATMEKELSLLCKSKSDEKLLNFKVLKTIGKGKFS